MFYIHTSYIYYINILVSKCKIPLYTRYIYETKVDKYSMSRQKYGGREKGTPNRLTSKVKDKLEQILDECIESLSVDDMSKQEKLKAIQLCLQYLMPKPTPEREDKNIVQHFEVEIIDNLKDQ